MMLCEICYNDIPVDIYVDHISNCYQNQLAEYNLHNVLFDPINEINVIDKIDANKSITLQPKLTSTQRLAIKYFKRKSKLYESNAMHLVENKFIDLGYDESALSDVIDYIKNVQHIIHFGPNLIPDIINKGRYKNTFEINNTNVPIRIDWENNLFNKLYTSDTKYEHRVKYGCLNLYSSDNGCTAATGYGKSYLILKPDIKNRTSFVYGDSALKQIHICSRDHFCHLLLYMRDNTIHDLVILAREHKRLLELLIFANNANGRRLNNTNSIDKANLIEQIGCLDHMNLKYSEYYVEIQVHGDICLDRDVVEYRLHHSHVNGQIIKELQDNNINFSLIY